MVRKAFPVIDPVATGRNIVRLRKKRGMTVRDLQDWFGFEAPRAIYKWQRSETLPSVDNLQALSALPGGFQNLPLLTFARNADGKAKSRICGDGKPV